MNYAYRLACLLTTIILFSPIASALTTDELTSDSLRHYAQMREGNWSVSGKLKQEIFGLAAGTSYKVNATAHWSLDNNNFMTGKLLDFPS